MGAASCWWWMKPWPIFLWAGLEGPAWAAQGQARAGGCRASCLPPWPLLPWAPVHFRLSLLVPSMSHAFGESYRVGSTKGVHAITVFCSWDYKVTEKRASRLQQDDIRTQLKVSGHLPAPQPQDPHQPTGSLQASLGSSV